MEKQTYDIFREFPDGQGPLWVEAVEGIESAEARVAALNEDKPGDYFIYDLRRKHRVPLQPETDAA